MKFKDILSKVYLWMCEAMVKAKNGENDFMAVVVLSQVIGLVIALVLSLVLPAISHADALQPIYDKAKSEWEGSGVLVAGLIGVVVGVVALLLGRGWMSLVYALIGAFLGGGASGIATSCVNTGKGVNWG
ncbi:hypothetical protein [Thermodesulfovibrio sp. TK110]